MGAQLIKDGSGKQRNDRLHEEVSKESEDVLPAEGGSPVKGVEGAYEGSG